MVFKYDEMQPNDAKNEGDYYGCPFSYRGH